MHLNDNDVINVRYNKAAPVMMTLKTMMSEVKPLGEVD